MIGTSSNPKEKFQKLIFKLSFTVKMVKEHWLNVSHFKGENFTDPFTLKLTTKGRLLGDLGRNTDTGRDFREAQGKMECSG